MYSDIGAHWIALYAFNNVTYFHSFGVEHIPKEMKILFDKSMVLTNIFRIQGYDLVMGVYFCIFVLHLLILWLQARL